MVILYLVFKREGDLCQVEKRYSTLKKHDGSRKGVKTRGTLRDLLIA